MGVAADLPDRSRAMKAATSQEHVSIEWGGDWRAIKDGPRRLLPWSLYP
jgi:peptidoglycan L-alanyl-D-glutamate endopeptidase CwlK